MHDRAMPSPRFGTSSRSRNGNFKTTPEYPHISTHWQREWGYFFCGLSDGIEALA
jgi:hypothetical protein